MTAEYVIKPATVSTWSWLELADGKQFASGEEIKIELQPGEQKTIFWENRKSVVKKVAGRIAADAKLNLIIFNNADLGAEIGTQWHWTLAGNSALQVVEINIGRTGKIDNRWQVYLLGSGGKVEINSFYEVTEAEVNLNYQVTHMNQQTRSLIETEGTLRDGARKNWQAVIDLRNGCTGSEAQEKENVLVLGEPKDNRSVPVILSGEENASGEHKVTSGGMSEEVIAYLASRGIDEKSAREFYVSCKLDAVAEKISDPQIREKIWAGISKGSVQ